MSNNTSFILVSGVVNSTDVSLTYLNTFYGNNLNPCINVYGSGILTELIEQRNNIDKSQIRLIACAVPSGVSGPVDVLDFISGYAANITSSNIKFTSFTDVPVNPLYPKHSVCYIKDSSVKGSNNKPITSPISGNAYYDLYSTHVLVVDNKKIIGYGSLVSNSGILTKAPYPLSNNFDSQIIDDGVSITGFELQRFKFEFDPTIDLFSNTDLYPGPAPLLSASGMIQMSCSGVSSGYYFPSGLYDGSNSSLSPLYGYCSVGETLEWIVPKLHENDLYAAYDFRINYIDLSGNLAGPLLLQYTSQQLHDFHTKPISLTNLTINSDNTNLGLDYITVEGSTGRSRLSVGLADIDLISTQYQEKGVYVSSIYTSEKPIYALSMDVNENIKKIAGYRSWDIVKYYIQFNLTESGEWYRISPKPRLNELDIENKNVPSVYILDSNLFAEDKVLDIYNTMSFIQFDKEQYNFRVKIEMDTNIAGSRGLWTPRIFDYRVSVIDRSALLYSNIERYLFN